MSLGSLKFSFGVSLLVHGLLIGGLAGLGTLRRAALVEVGDSATLELIAAPAAAADMAVESSTKTTPPTPLPPLTPPAPEEIVLTEPAPPTAIIEAISPERPKPASFPEQRELIPVLPVVVASSAPTVSVTGDNSAPLPGSDSISAPGQPTATAKPDYLKNPEPEYPLTARRRNQQGTVVLSVMVNAAGRATDVSVKESSGYELLDQAALRAVRTWEFQPARVGAVSVASRIEVPVRFKLTN